MASIENVYGSGFHEGAVRDRALYAAKLYATNIVHRQFSFRNDSYEMWEGNNMKKDIIKAMIGQVKTANSNMRLVHVSKTSQDVNMFPYLIIGPVEYFVLVDMTGGEKTQLYSIYITPTHMSSY
mgnify:CR=1 FL=1